jgi:hypothetical protein
MPIPLVAAGTVVVVGGIRLVAVPLAKIVKPVLSELNPARLDQLKSGINKLDEILTNPNWRGDPIALTRKGNMFSITDGRHRIYLATQKAKDGLNYVWAIILN